MRQLQASPRTDRRDDLRIAWSVLDATKENYRIKTIIDFIKGTPTKEMLDYGFTSYDPSAKARTR